MSSSTTSEKFNRFKLEQETIVSIIGIALEYYSIFIYGYISHIIITQFFVSNSHLVTLSAFFFSYIIGPLGAVFCGYIGDTQGRKKILAVTVACISLTTFLISILPTYDQIGIAASILFIILRSIQTMAFAGDMIGLVTFILEDAPPSHRGWYGGLMSMGAGIGVGLASIVTSTYLDPLEDPVSTWKWRVLLSIGIFGMCVAIYFNRIFKETDTFKNYRDKHYIKTSPILDVFRNNKIKILKTVGLTALVPIITLIVFGFIPYFGIKHLDLSSKTSMYFNAVSLFVFTISAPFFGLLSDKIGRRAILFAVSLSYLILGLPLFYLLDYATCTLFFLMQLLLAFIASAYYGVTMTTCIEYFPTHIRYTGVALGYYITYALFGGINGLYIIGLLVKDLHLDYAPVFYLLLGSAFVFVATLSLRKGYVYELPNR